MFVGAMQALRERCVNLSEDAPLIEAARLLAQAPINLVTIVDSGDHLVGVVTKTDVVRQIGVCAGNGCRMPVAAVMTRDVITCRPEEWLADVWPRMRDRAMKYLPVIDRESRPIGVLYARDALSVLLEEATYEELLLREYVLRVGYH